MTKRSNIKILVACHKPSELPDNKLMLPVQVGATNAKTDLGLQRDDDGDNISAKNPGYCELTALYWAWKNLDADYYGLFHYRRFYSFADEKFPVSDDGHCMIRAKALSPMVFHKFGLDDEAKMRQIIESNDLIVHEPRPVAEIPTPRGIDGKNVYDHYRLHDGTIIKTTDIDQMLKLIDDKYPTEAPYIHEYMKGRTFLGYNMFIMRKKFFNAMCSFEFDVLGQMEQLIGSDLPNRSKNANRIYGYLAEILTSAYIYYIQRSNPDLHVRKLQMIYALETDKLQYLKPIDSAKTIVFDLTSMNPGGSESMQLSNEVAKRTLYFLPVLSRFIDKIDTNTKYDVILAINGKLDKITEGAINQIVGRVNNVSLRYLNAAPWLMSTDEVYNYKVPLNVLLPWILRDYSNKVALLSWNCWINSDIADLFKEAVGTGIAVWSAVNSFLEGCLREISPEHKKARIEILGEDLGLKEDDIVYDSVLIYDMSIARNLRPINEVAGKYAKLNVRYGSGEILSYLYRGKSSHLDQTWNYQIPTDSGVDYVENFFTSIVYNKKWSKLLGDYKLGSFFADSVEAPSIGGARCSFILDYYTEFSRLAIWPLAHTVIAKSTISVDNNYQPDGGLRLKLVPLGSRRDRLATMFLPKGSARRHVVHKLYHKIFDK